MTLARKAVIAEIRDKGRRVNSIAPSKLQRLVEFLNSEHSPLHDADNRKLIDQ
jgi:hypothetical protein